VGCKVRFTLTVRMRKDLQPYCEVTYMEAEHTGHVGADALPHQRQQRRLSEAAAQHVAQCLSLGMSPTDILSTNMLRIKREWLRIHSSAASDEVRCSLGLRSCRAIVCLVRLTSVPQLRLALTRAPVLTLQDFIDWLEAHPESQEARDAHLTWQDIRNIQNRVPANQPKLDRFQVHSHRTFAWLRSFWGRPATLAQ